MPADLLDSLCDTRTPQGVLFLAKMPVLTPPERLTGDRWLILDGLQDPGQAGPPPDCRAISHRITAAATAAFSDSHRARMGIFRVFSLTRPKARTAAKAHSRLPLGARQSRT